MAIVKFYNPIDKHREEKIKELNQECSKTILGKFSCEVNNSTYYFSNDMEAQANFEKCDRAFEKGRIVELAWTCYDSNGNIARLLLTKETFEQIYLSHLNHIQSNIAKFRDSLMPRVLMANSKDDIDKIVWVEQEVVEEEIITDVIE